MFFEVIDSKIHNIKKIGYSALREISRVVNYPSKLIQHRTIGRKNILSLEGTFKDAIKQIRYFLEDI